MSAADLTPLVSLVDEVALSSKLLQVARRRRLQNLTVGLVAHGQEAFAAIGPEGEVLDSLTARQRLIGAGCLAKSVTATLIAEVVASGKLGWDEDVGQILAASRVAGVTVMHLLNHTHGLDASLIEHLPRRADGFIDTSRLCGELGSRSLAAPGALYSYGNAGPWLAGAVLERIHAVPYGALLRERGLAGTAEAAPGETDGEVCPATGHGLMLSCRQWLEFLGSHLAPANPEAASSWWSSPVRMLGEKRVPLPGWSLFEKEVGLGWKGYGKTCLGHNSNLEGHSAVLRFFPGARLGVIVCAEGEGTTVFLLAGLFGTALPEFADFRMPRPLRAEEQAEELRPERYVGCYSRCDTRLTVSSDAHAMLLLVVTDLRTGRESAQCRLRPAEQQLFIPEPREDPELAFVQFIEYNATGAAEYLWNGRLLWRRE